MNRYLVYTIYILCIINIIIFIIHQIIKDKFTNYIKFKSVVIIGTARDVEEYLPILIEKIENILSLFEKGSIIIYENDSKDKTLEILNNWNKARIISEKNVPGERAHRLEHGRNILLEEALKENSEYIIVIDMDDKNINITNEAILSSLNHINKDWAVMGANQNEKYYDLWALRTFDSWMPADVWHCEIDTTISDSMMRKIPKDENLIEVKSCFGGLAIYKTKYLKGCKYDGRSKPRFRCNYEGTGVANEKCEHVSLNECIRNNGGKIFINPKMINS